MRVVWTKNGTVLEESKVELWASVGTGFGSAPVKFFIDNELKRTL